MASKALGRRQLGITGSHRRSLLRNMATSLFKHERIERQFRIQRRHKLAKRPRLRRRWLRAAFHDQRRCLLVRLTTRGYAKRALRDTYTFRAAHVRQPRVVRIVGINQAAGKHQC